MKTNKYILDFQKALIDTKNKKYLIEKEIKQIEIVISTSRAAFTYNSISHVGQEVMTNGVFKEKIYADDRFNSFFHQYIENDGFDFESIPNDKYKNHTEYIMNKAMPFADYYLWLKEQLQNFTENKATKTSDLNLSQKILALHYLGLDLTKFDKTKSSKVLSKILEQSESNTKGHLTNLYSAINETKIKNLKNLKPLLEVFENEQFNEVQNKIKKDIENLG